MKQCKNLPEQFISKLYTQFDSSIADTILESFHVTRPVTFRINTLKATVSDISVSLQEQGFQIQQVPWLHTAFILQNKSKRDLTETEEFNNGFIYLQNLSSMVPVLVLDPQTTDTVLDIAAAPGSKTTQSAVQMSNHGQIIANDISRQRVFKLQANLEHQGVTNTKVLTIAAQRIWEQYPEYFDKTLVDVACSMEGRFECDNPGTYKDWSAKKVKILSNQQKFILRSAISATKPGGIIVYSTCTLSREENESVIEWILQKEQEKISIEDILIPGLNLSSGIADHNQELIKTKRIIPTDTMEGFFIAKIKKISSTIPSHMHL